MTGVDWLAGFGTEVMTAGALTAGEAGANAYPPA